MRRSSIACFSSSLGPFLRQSLRLRRPGAAGTPRTLPRRCAGTPATRHSAPPIMPAISRGDGLDRLVALDEHVDGLTRGAQGVGAAQRRHARGRDRGRVHGAGEELRPRSCATSPLGRGDLGGRSRLHDRHGADGARPDGQGRRSGCASRRDAPANGAGRFVEAVAGAPLDPWSRRRRRRRRSGLSSAPATPVRLRQRRRRRRSTRPGRRAPRVLSRPRSRRGRRRRAAAIAAAAAARTFLGVVARGQRGGDGGDRLLRSVTRT